MKVVILAGGMGTRLSEETVVRPKPMVEIGGMPILWHIMKIYSHYGYNDFVICLGYKGYMIKEYFTNYFYHMSDITVDLQNNKVEIHKNEAEPWKVTLVDTGDETMTGGRIKRVQKYVGDERFMLTYGDGVSNVDINDLVKFHKKKKKLATLTAIRPAGRFGALNMSSDGSVKDFIEKPKGDGDYVNGGFFVLEPEVFDLIDGDSTIWERKPLETLAQEGQLSAYRHDGFWAPMDTLRDKNYLEGLWTKNQAPWKMW
ncbi:MAG: UTP--glucose-1-phosphate uridylyltransferase AglF [Methanomassiliicoccales archaeon PtaU1.Bin124]|nr:MAG: UTP--glucose-1-phosphate uridylyltransferase AglF [Methanomassiliicoccales archaeon PtaU1.Bin124]